MKEDHFELGGYFICGGNEKVIRLLNMNKRNHPFGLNRSGWAKRRPGYRASGVMISYQLQILSRLTLERTRSKHAARTGGLFGQIIFLVFLNVLVFLRNFEENLEQKLVLI